MANHRTKVSCYDYDGNFIRTFDSLTEAKAAFGADSANIRRAAKTGGLCRKMYWKIETLDRGNSTDKLPVWQWLPDGTFCEEYESCMQAERFTGAQARNISRCAKGRLWSAGGYRWTFKGTKLIVEPNPRTYANGRPNISTSKPVCVVRIKQGGGYTEGDIEYYTSITNATNALGLRPSCRSEVSKAMNGIRYSAVGYYWFTPDTEDIIGAIEDIERKRAAGIHYRVRRGHESLDKLFGE